ASSSTMRPVFPAAARHGQRPQVCRRPSARGGGAPLGPPRPALPRQPCRGARRGHNAATGVHRSDLTATERLRGCRRHGCGGNLSEPGTRGSTLPDRRAAPMKLPHVDYEAPKSVSEAVEMLAEHLDEAGVLAGGQSLIPLLALRLARPAVLIDINGIAELSGVSVADGWMAIGAMTREYVAEESETVAGTVPLLAAALPLVGHEAIRSRGTVGGSLAHADPAAEVPAVARALDAEFVVCGPSG